MPKFFEPILVKTHMAKYGLRNRKLPNVRASANGLCSARHVYHVLAGGGFPDNWETISANHSPRAAPS